MSKDDEKKDFIQDAIKRPGALTRRAKRNGRSILEQARKDKSSGTTLEKRQANFYLNTLRPIAQKKKKKKSLMRK